MANEVGDRSSYYYVNGKKVPLERQPAAYAVRYRPGQHARSPQVATRARRFLVEDSRFLSRVAEYGLQVYQAVARSTRLDAGNGKSDNAAVDAEVRFLNASEAVEYATPVFRQTSSSNVPMFVTNQFLVQFKPDMSRQAQQALHERYAVRQVRALPYVENGYLLEATDLAQFDLIEIANAYFESGLVIFSHPNFVTLHMPRKDAGKPRESRARSTPLTPRRWHLEMCHVTEAWVITRGRPEVAIAVLDDGIDVEHPEFAGRVVEQYDFDAHVTNGRPKESTDNHGTACTSVAAAAGVKAFGAAPACSIIAARTPTWLATSDEADMFRWAADQGADIITCSWGPEDNMGPFPMPNATQAAIHYCLQNGRGGKGIPIFFAAGNGNESVSDDGYASHPEVIAVAACTSEATRASYSDFGPEIWVSAPSSGGTRSVFTADRRGTDGYNPEEGGPADDTAYFERFGGTSSAAPLVAGIAALMLSVNDNLTAVDVRNILKETADRIGGGAEYDAGGHSIHFGYGRVNALRAVQQAQARPAAEGERPVRASSIVPQREAVSCCDSPPSFEVDTGDRARYAVEVATSALLLDAAKHEAERNNRNFYGSWQDTSLLSAPTYQLPQEVWTRLALTDRLYYRAHFADDDNWTNHTLTVFDDEAASAPSIQITDIARRGRMPGVTYPSGATFAVVTAPLDGRDYSDPIAGGVVPLIKIEGRGNEQLSADFQVYQLEASDGAGYARISPDLVAGLQSLRNRLGTPIHIVSGYRYPELNTEIEGVERSQHVAGRAADIYVDGMTPLELAGYALDEMGCKIGIGLGPNTIHLDVGGMLDSWVYQGAVLTESAFSQWVQDRCGQRSARSRIEVTQRLQPSIEGPESAPGGGPPPVLTVQLGLNRYYAVELATDWRLFAPEKYGVHRTKDNFYGSWQDRLEEGRGKATYELPDDVWKRLRDQGRIYYRAVTMSSPGDKPSAFQTSVSDDAAAEALAIEITGRSARMDNSVLTLPSVNELKRASWQRWIDKGDGG